jgi:dolichol-phosphate mannosyltransferase
VEKRPEICVVMPAYNEEGCIAAVVGGVTTFFESRFSDFRVVVVNDGSRDGTGSILDQIATNDARVVVVHQPNGGHGRALVRGYTEALNLKPEWIFQIDSDDQFEIADFDKLWAQRDSSRFITGRRLERHDAFHRLIITRILRGLNLLMFGSYIPDANIPFRLIRGSYLTTLLTVIPPGVFAPNIFLSVLANAAGERLGQIPVSHKDRRTGTVSIVKWGLIKACLRSAKELAGFRLELGRAVAAVRSSLA